MAPKAFNESAETKAKVAQNGVKPTLCARFRVLDEVEKQENFDAFLNQLMEDEQPVGQAEIELVVKMAEHTWVAKRALRMQGNCLSPEPKTPEQVKNGDIPVGIEVNPSNSTCATTPRTTVPTSAPPPSFRNARKHGS